MKKYDDIVVGAGIGGLTLAVLLSMNNRKVLLLEKNASIGGAMKRFYRKGAPFDTGFHFTGGFYKGGVLHDMLTVLGIHDYIEPVFLSTGEANRFVFESDGLAYDMQPGISNLRQNLKKYFPGEQMAIDKYFDMVTMVSEKTVSLDLRKISMSPDVIEEDFISLDEVLNGLTQNKLLKALLSTYTMCYGVKPEEISFANHSRVCYGLYESVARIKRGGEAFIDAFKGEISRLGIDVMCNSYIVDCQDINNDYVGRFVLNNGQEFTCENCIFTIHPQEIVKVLPKKHLTRAFIDRVSSFEPTIGFFLVFGLILDEKPCKDFKSTIVSLLPAADFNQLLSPDYQGKSALVIMRSLEEAGGKIYKTINTFEPSFAKTVEAWKDSKIGRRPKTYQEYKKKRIERIRQRICQYYPQYNDSLNIVDAASILTFRDYLNSPDGSAYGIKQKIGQYNLFGKLPLRNVYAAGQSSVLPGIVGAMLSSFIVGRSIIGKNDYNNFIENRLCN
ncbi:MAG: NAD(P)-binding protein [Candidatus Omnitrophica bacterium]|nr:NAD(P)-binding protein [Candidatus Omnitrophota bacterium]